VSFVIDFDVLPWTSHRITASTAQLPTFGMSVLADGKVFWPGWLNMMIGLLMAKRKYVRA
jgi:hypothetical protein